MDCTLTRSREFHREIPGKRGTLEHHRSFRKFLKVVRGFFGYDIPQKLYSICYLYGLFRFTDSIMGSMIVPKTNRKWDELGVWELFHIASNLLPTWILRSSKQATLPPHHRPLIDKRFPRA